MAMPCSLQASIDSWSRTEPPGCTIAVDARCRRQIDVVAEREERIRRQHAPLLAAIRLAHGHVRRIDPAHLPGADADDHAILAQHDGVALDMLGDDPRELQIGQLRVGRRPLRHRLSTLARNRRLSDIPRSLHQQPAIDAAKIERPGRVVRQGARCSASRTLAFHLGRVVRISNAALL